MKTKTKHGAGTGGGRRLFAEAAACLVLGAALAIVLLATAVVLVALARFRRLALKSFAGIAVGAALRLILLLAAILFLAAASVGKCAQAGVALLVGERAQDDAGTRCVRRRAAGCARWPCWAGEACAAFAAGAACATGFSSLPPPGPTARRLTVSTTTAFERPCEKLWRTMPCSTGRFRDSVLGDTCNVLSPGFFVSFIPLRSCGFYQIIGSRAPPRGSL